MTIGIPYARAFVRDSGEYGVTCPVCGLEVVVPEPLSEDHATKGANLAYGIHYETEHKPKPLIRHRDVAADSQCGGQVASGKELFHVDYWCVYCGAKFDAAICDLCSEPAIGVLGGTDWYCARHQKAVEDDHAANLKMIGR